MKIFVNDDSVTIAEHSNISQLLAQLTFPSKGIAIAIGHKIIPLSQWDNYLLKENDKVLLIRATQGG
ncbi:sulfur carrier protein ThiS [Ancylomarina sp.]|uniref:sulfur carrier protein ThiS n=1 Tax=Ancylomarina sp. TaxID=1970196 RepID=UPI00356355C1